MSDVQSAAAARAQSQARVAELKVSGHLMNLDPGLFCIVQAPSRGAESAAGLPGVRISLAPGGMTHPDAVSIRSFRDDGWLGAGGDAALVRVSGGPAQILVTVYQAAGAADSAPSLQVLKLIDPAAQPAAVPPPVASRAAAETRPLEVMDLLAHIQGRGDVGGRLGEWVGIVGSKAWVEGFAIAPTREVAPDDIEYQAVLGRGWLSPWVEGGQFCGSRGMALPVLGLRVRLRGKAAAEFDCFCSGSFVDGTQVGPIGEGEACEAESLAAMEAFKVTLRRKGEAEGDTDPARGMRAKADKPLAARIGRVKAG